MRFLLASVLSLLMTVAAMAAEEVHGAAEEGASNVFAGTVAQSIAAAIVFLILVALLYKTAWGPILKGLQDRENRIKEDLEGAERAAKEATAKLEQYNRQLAEANVAAAKVIDESKADAQRLAGQIKDQAQQEITALKTRAEGDIQAAREQALADIYAQTAMLATAVAGRILQREIRAEDQAELVEQALDEFARTSRN